EVVSFRDLGDLGCPAGDLEDLVRPAGDLEDLGARLAILSGCCRSDRQEVLKIPFRRKTQPAILSRSCRSHHQKLLKIAGSSGLRPKAPQDRREQRPTTKSSSRSPGAGAGNTCSRPTADTCPRSLA